MRKVPQEFKLLTRDEFREGVFNRDKHKCLLCDALAQDAHHILERRLWPDGGYYLENGASVCEKHHLLAEQTLVTCDELRELAGITKFPLPPQLYRDQAYDKWGNPILDNGTRLRGELFDDPSVQRVLSFVLSVFTNRVKYPRTYHLPWSPGVNKDDRVLEDLSSFMAARTVVITVKMDGENTTMYHDYLHARSIDYNPHPSRSWVKALHASIKHDIPENWRICGENLYAQHSIAYSKLEEYFQVFSIWDEHNRCLSWEQTKEWATLLGLRTVPVLYVGPWDEQFVRKLYSPEVNGEPCEGYVVRVEDTFHYRDFRYNVAKYVREGHVQTHGHWMRSTVVPNKLASEE
jgi:hypothetical protein